MNIITFGTFDLLHIGHINILERSKNKGNKLRKYFAVIFPCSYIFIMNKK